MSATMLLKVAEVLEQAANYIENVEADRLSKEAQQKLAEAQTLANKITATTGNPLTADMVEKLSQAPKDVQRLIREIATGDDVVDSLGGPETTAMKKTASVRAETGSAEQALMDFLSM
jgi:DNA-binding PucR family transcriptional regulator